MTAVPSTLDLDTLQSFTAVFDQLKKEGLLTPAITMAQLTERLDDKQQQMVQQIVNLRPEDYGVSIPYLGIEEAMPSALVVVSGQKYNENGAIKTLYDKRIPRLVYEAFTRMNTAFESDYPGRQLLIESAYRSPASQVITFISWCTKAYAGDIARTIRHASPPAYSQHTHGSKTAVDIKNVDGLPTGDHPEDFKTTIEYAWLREHAQEYEFYESWPEGNENGMRPEPWHWQYRG